MAFDQLEHKVKTRTGSSFLVASCRKTYFMSSSVRAYLGCYRRSEFHILKLVLHYGDKYF